MYKFNNFIFTQALFLTTLIISGCNDGSSTSNITPNESQEESRITTSNAKPVAAAAFASVDAVKGLPMQSGTVISSSDDAASGKFIYSDFIIEQLTLIQQQNRLMGRNISNVSAATANKAFDCNLQIAGEIADESKLSAGDTVSFSFGNCTYDSDLIINGTIGITLTQITEGFTGTPPYELGMLTELTDFQVENQGTAFTSNGDLSMLINENVYGERAAQINGALMSISFGSASKNNSLTLSDYLIELEENDTQDYSVSSQGTIEIAIPFVSINASFTTITPFTGNYDVSAGNPTAGELHLTGALGSQAWVIAQPDGVNIQIDIDADGDGVVEDTIMTNWTELQDIF